jgi:ferredoxin
MNRPCIVCEENCPVSPKAIYTQEYFTTIRDGILQVKKATDVKIEIVGNKLAAGKYATGDYYCAVKGERIGKITSHSENSIDILRQSQLKIIPSEGDNVEIQVRLQQPYLDLEKCIGCGVCEHECPVSGKKAIRVSAEGETRSQDRSLLLSG